MIWLKENWFKIVAIILLFWASSDHPYAYYQILRWIIMIIAGYSAYISNEKNMVAWMWIFIAVAILFNPILPFYMKKETWQIFDIATGILFLISLFYKSKGQVEIKGRNTMQT